MFKRDELRYIVAFRYVSNNKKMNKYLLQLKLPPVYHFSIRRWTRPSTITNTYTRTTTTTWFWIIWYQVHMIYLITTLTVLFYYRNIRRWNWRWEVNHSHHSAKNHIKISKNYLRGYRNPFGSSLDINYLTTICFSEAYKYAIVSMNLLRTPKTTDSNNIRLSTHVCYS